MIIRKGVGPLLSISVYWGALSVHFLAWRWYPVVSFDLKRGFRLLPILFIERSPERNRKVAAIR